MHNIFVALNVVKSLKSFSFNRCREKQKEEILQRGAKHVCLECGASFRTKAHLTQHEAVHIPVIKFTEKTTRMFIIKKENYLLKFQFRKAVK